MFDYPAFVDAITEYRRTHGITCTEFCKRAGISKNAYRYYVNQRTMPNVKMYCGICAAMECSPEKFFGHDGQTVTFDKDKWLSRIYAAQMYSGMGSSEVAERMGCKRAIYSQYRRGRALMPIDTAARFAEVTNVPLIWLLGGWLD